MTTKTSRGSADRNAAVSRSWPDGSNRRPRRAALDAGFEAAGRAVASELVSRETNLRNCGRRHDILASHRFCYDPSVPIDRKSTVS